MPEEPPVCSANACVHYVASTVDAPDLTDTDADGVPDWVQTVSDVIEEAWAEEVTTLGYRPPKSDITSDNNGGNGKIDFYLADVGAEELYGYCFTDDPNLDSSSQYPYFDFSAYCVIDNDFSPGQFPGVSGLDALRVTVAHEFFHAVQFAYDAAEDLWFMEGTATWIEDWVYDDVDDNLQYLPYGPLGKPSVPMDKSGGSHVYGEWIFWEFLTQYFGDPDPDPTVIRRTWRRADGSPVGPDDYSTEALANAIHAIEIDGTPWRLRWTFADFGAWNAAPRHFYSDGQAGQYPAPPVAKGVTLRTGHLAMPATTYFLNHLTNRYVVLRPGTGVHRSAKVRIKMNGPTPAHGTEGSAVVFKKTGAIAIVPFSIDADGDAVRSVPFGRATVSKVVVVLTNASARFTNCYAGGTMYSCNGGIPRDDHQKFMVSAKVIQ